MRKQPLSREDLALKTRKKEVTKLYMIYMSPPRIKITSIKLARGRCKYNNSTNKSAKQEKKKKKGSTEPYQIATPWALQHSTHAINPPHRSKPKAAGRNSEEEKCGGNDLRASRQPRLSRSLWFGYSIRLAQQFSLFPLVTSLKPLVPVHT
jgi:hypothetical protein